MTRARRRLEMLGPERVAPGLERIRALLRGLDNPQQAYPTAIVAGTNGKGSTVAMLASIGRAAGIRVGCYTSPHLVGIEERFQIDGYLISPDGFEAHLDLVLSTADRLLSSGVLHEQPTYFEILTAVAFRYFADARVDLAVLEVGLGGRLDATNVTCPRVALITPIAVDHADWLGSELHKIADEKFAVVPEAGMAVIAPQPSEVMEVIRQRARERRITLLETDSYALEVRHADDRLRCTFDLDGRLRSYRGLQLALPGRHQVDNARCAILASEALDRRRMRIAADAIWAGLRKATVPGRCQWIEGPPRALFDGAHNPAAAQALARYLAELREGGAFARLHLVFGALSDKDLHGMAAPLFAQADTLVTTRPTSARGASAQQALAAGTPPATHAAIEDPELALALALEWTRPDDLICVTGSLFLVGSLSPLLGSSETS